MDTMSQEDWKRFKQDIMRQVDFILDSDLEHLRRMDQAKRADLWNQIAGNQDTFESEFIMNLPRDIMLNSRSKFALAGLLLAAAAHSNSEEDALATRYNTKELALVENFEKFSVFDILSTDEIVERIFRRADIYELVRDFYEGQYADLDSLLDDPKIQRDLKYAFKFRYKTRLSKIAEGVQAYVGKYGPIIVVDQIEQKVWKDIKQSEEERKAIADSLRKRMDEVASKLRSFDDVERESDLFRDRLREVEQTMLTGTEPQNIGGLESEKDRLMESYLGFEKELASLIDTTADKQRELEIREADLEKARKEYEQLTQEDKQRLVENELKEIQALKGEIESEMKGLQDEKSSLQLKRDEISDRVRQISETYEGKSIRFVVKEDAKLSELNLIARFDTKMQTFPLKLYSPIEKKTYDIKSWKDGSHLKFAEDSSPDAPSNARSRYMIRERKHGFFGAHVNKVVIEAVSLNHLQEYEEYGFDTRRANLSEFLALISRFIDSAEIGSYLHILGIASPTGWDERVKEAITSTDFARNYVSRFVSICLIDSASGDVLHNAADDRITGFIDFFRPQFDKERVESIKTHINKGLTLKDYVVFQDVAQETGEERTFLNKAFHDIAHEEGRRSRYIKDVGLVLEVVR